MSKKGDKIVKRSIEFIAVCYLVYLVGSMGFIGTLPILDGTHNFIRPSTSDILGIHIFIGDYGLPAVADVEFLEKQFCGDYRGKTVMVNFTFEHCIMESVYVYWRYKRSIFEFDSKDNLTIYRGRFSFGDADSLIKFGNATVVSFTVDERSEWNNPFVLVVAVTPMGWDNDLPLHRGQITIKVI